MAGAEFACPFLSTTCTVHSAVLTLPCDSDSSFNLSNLFNDFLCQNTEECIKKELLLIKEKTSALQKIKNIIFLNSPKASIKMNSILLLRLQRLNRSQRNSRMLFSKSTKREQNNAGCLSGEQSH